ncbi:MAG: radical SAM protein [Candidatus Omnitrophota bacterium]
MECATCEPSLGLAHIASFISSNKVDVTLYDFDMLAVDMSYIRALLEKKSPDMVGISFLTANRHVAFEIARIAKSLSAFVVAGGPHITFTAQETLRGISAFDVAVVGEGEITMGELLQYLEKKKNLEDISGIAYRKNGNIVLNPTRPLLQDINILPEPAWHLLPIAEYPEYALMGTRGCWEGCIFCNSPAFWQKKIRYILPQRLVDWAEHLTKDYGKKTIRFRDDYFTGNKKWVLAVCEEILRRKLKIRWECQGRVDHVDSEVFKMMRKAGCYKISFGVESGNERILAYIHKNINRDDVKQAIQLARKCGFEQIVTLFMLGHPTETLQTLEETYRFALELRADLVSFKPTDIFPGTQLYTYAIQNGVLPLNFNWLEKGIWKRGFCTEVDVPVYENPELKRTDLEKISKLFFMRSYIDRLLSYANYRDITYFKVTQFGFGFNLRDFSLFCQQLNQSLCNQKWIRLVSIIFFTVLLLVYKTIKSIIRRIRLKWMYIRVELFYRI